MALDTARATRRLSEAGLSDEAALAVADLVAEATAGLATQASVDTGFATIRKEMAELRADVFRALWRQAGAFIAALAVGLTILRLTL